MINLPPVTRMRLASKMNSLTLVAIKDSEKTATLTVLSSSGVLRMSQAVTLLLIIKVYF